MRTGRGGKGLGSRYEVCIEEEELEEERRVVREAEVEETGARSAPGRVTGGKKGKQKEKKRYKILLSSCSIALKMVRENNMT